MGAHPGSSSFVDRAVRDPQGQQDMLPDLLETAAQGGSDESMHDIQAAVGQLLLDAGTAEGMSYPRSMLSAMSATS